MAQVPPCWYQPVEHKGVYWHPDTGEVNEVAPDNKHAEHTEVDEQAPGNKHAEHTVREQGVEGLKESPSGNGAA